MTRDEVRRLLALAAACENRGWSPTSVDVDAWTLLLGDVELAEAEQALAAHYRETHTRVAPADLRRTVRAARADRLARQVELPPDADPDDPRAYLAALRAGRIRAVHDDAPRDMRVIEGTFPSVPAVPATDVAAWRDTRAQLARRPAAARPMTYRESMAALEELVARHEPPVPDAAAAGTEVVDLADEPVPSEVPS